MLAQGLVEGVDGDAVELVDVGRGAPGEGHFAEVGERAVLVLDGEVDLAGLGVSAGVGDERAHLASGGFQDREHDAHGDRAGIGVEVVAEVEVAGELAAEDRVLLGQHGLHEHVPDAAAIRHAAGLEDVLADGLRGTQVVDDGGALARLFDEIRGENGGEVVAADDGAVLIDDNAAVRVAVVAEAAIRADGDDLLLELSEVAGHEGIGIVDELALAVVEVDLDDLEARHRPERGFFAEDHRDHGSGHAIGGVDDDLELGAFVPLVGEVEELAHVAGVGLPEIALLGATAGVVGGGFVGHGRVLAHVRQAGGLAHGLGLALGDLKPVVLRRVVAGGTHHAAGAVQVVHGEVDETGVHEPDIDDVSALVVDALDQGFGKRGRTLAHIAPDDDVVHHRAGLARVGGVGDQELGDAEADLPGHLLVERVRVDAADVVCLEDLAEHGWLRRAKGKEVGVGQGERVGRELRVFRTVLILFDTLFRWISWLNDSGTDVLRRIGRKNRSPRARRARWGE